MKVKIKSGLFTDAIAWKFVKGWLLLVMVWLTLPPFPEKVSGRFEGGSKTVLAGHIRAVQLVPVTVEFVGRAVSVRVKPGQVVAEGELLAELESPEVVERLDRARRRLAFATSRLRSKPQTAALLWREQQQSTVQQHQEAQSRLAAYSLDVVEANYARSQREVTTISNLVQQHLATVQDLEAARRQLDVDLATLENAKRTKTRLEHETRAAASQLKMVMIQKANGEPAVDPAAELEYEDATTAVETAERQFKALRVVAPVSGTVLTVSVQPGEAAGGWAPLFQMADLQKLQIEVPVTARLAGMIRGGSPVNVVIPGDPPQAVPASVKDIQLVPDQLERSHVVRIVVPNPQPGSILIGMECTVEFAHGGML
ncbi:MAG: efflux RND transporter periplasmic adaptor subunit [Acidobacteria bacterium]|nr:efflux RND transporter periplasmic adaptor subunit [Acidobacteriota bacterium]